MDDVIASYYANYQGGIAYSSDYLDDATVHNEDYALGIARTLGQARADEAAGEACRVVGVIEDGFVRAASGRIGWDFDQATTY